MQVWRDNLRKHVDYLSSPELKGREFGSEGCRLASLYVKKHFEEYGLSAPDKYPDYLQILPWRGQNVLAILHGSDPELANECVIVDAHQDHMGDGFAGASDNAAGMAVLLELARAFSEVKEKLKRSIVFACFDGEEQILNIDGKKQLMQGATYYVKNPVFDMKNTCAMLTLDTLGRNFFSTDLLFVLGLERSLFLQSIIGECASSSRKIMFSTDLLTGIIGNYLPFVDKKVPSLFVSNGTHQDYHGKGDTAEKISYDLLYDDSTFINDLVSRIANAENKPDFCKNPVCPAGEAEDILYLLTLLKDAVNASEAGDASKFDFIIDKLRKSPSNKEMKQAIQIFLGFATPNFAKLYLLLNEAQNAEKRKQYSEAIRYYNEILDLYNEYSVPYLWLQEIRGKVTSLEKKSR
jgi:hypothetical protein